MAVVPARVVLEAHDVVRARRSIGAESVTSGGSRRAGVGELGIAGRAFGVYVNPAGGARSRFTCRTQPALAITID